MILTRMGVVAASKQVVAGNVDITLYSSVGPYGFLDLAGYQIFYSTNLTSGWDFWPFILECPLNETCEQYGSITVSSNTTVYIAARDCFGNFVSYNAADNTSTCPSNTAAYCYDYGAPSGTAFSFNSGTTNKDVAVNVYIQQNVGYSVCA